MSDWIEEGQKAPDFNLAADNGEKIKLSALRGRPVVLYFYPRDDTPGCTREACAFRDQKAALAKLSARVLGISSDDVASHVKFRDKFQLNFPLLADADHKVAEKYGCGRKSRSMGTMPRCWPRSRD
jgi:thioredoxin-dependent peroxiredoxin